MTPKIGSLGVIVNEKTIKLRFDEKLVEYSKKKDGECTVTRYKCEDGGCCERVFKQSTVTLPEDFVKRAVEDFGIALEIPEIKVKNFYVHIGKGHGSDEVFHLLKKRFKDRVIHAEKTSIVIDSYEKVLEILAMLQPKVLYKFCSRLNNDAKIENISGFFAMEQFKLAKIMKIDKLVIFDARHIFDHFHRFREFEVRVHSMNAEQILRLRQMIASELNSTKFQECVIRIVKHLTTADFKSIRRALEMAEDETHFIVHRHNIPNSNGAYLNIKIQNCAIEVGWRANDDSSNIDDFTYVIYEDS